MACQDHVFDAVHIFLREVRAHHAFICHYALKDFHRHLLMRPEDAVNELDSAVLPGLHICGLMGVLRDSERLLLGEWKTNI